MVRHADLLRLFNRFVTETSQQCSCRSPGEALLARLPEADYRPGMGRRWLLGTRPAGR
jgi:hypothetical protein